MKRRTSVFGCAAMLALGGIVIGGLLVAFGYWWDAAHPTDFMQPRWDTLLLAFVPWLIGVIAIGAGGLVGFFGAHRMADHKVAGASRDVTGSGFAPGCIVGAVLSGGFSA
jgi:hypothetical protein